jgi:hypothetical protein
MKKVLFVAMCVVALASCAPKQSSDAVVNEDSISVVDTLEVDTMAIDTTSVEVVEVN